MARLLAACLIFFAAVTPGWAAESTYHIGPGDELSINFPLQGNLSDLSKLSGNSLAIQIVGDDVYWHHQVLVAPDGFISLPSLAPIKASGFTLEQMQQAIMGQLKRPYRNSLVSVILTKPNSTAFYVWGEVKNPGRFVFERPTNLVEALGTAGGGTERARLKRVLLLRAGQPPRTFNLSPKHILKAGVPDVPLQPADTIIVQRRFLLDGYVVFLLLTAITAATSVYAIRK